MGPKADPAGAMKFPVEKSRAEALLAIGKNKRTGVPVYHWKVQRKAPGQMDAAALY